MQKTIPFKKEILFKNTIEEISNISIDHKLEMDGNMIKGEILVTGEYQYTNQKESFNLSIPYSSYIEEEYITDEAKLDISDFYYEITEPTKLCIFIDISVDNLSEKPLIGLDSIEPKEESEIDDRIDLTETSLFSNHTDMQEAYITYKVYIVREGDTIQSVLEKYDITHEQLMKYNIVNELIVGEKLIIPHEKNK